MKIVYSWLKDFVDIAIPVSELADALTSAGLEVASVRELSIPKGIKVAHVLEVAKHPNADKLSLCKVDIGRNEPLQIVCGASNVVAGMHAALATEGTVLPEFTIKKSKIRGIESYGMLCSEKELTISDDHSGIMTLPTDFKVGTQLSEYFPDDAVIEIEITPDRGDCLSVLGVAREVSARFGVLLQSTARRPEETSDDAVESAISVTIESPQSCPRYTGRLVRNVTLAPSPQWMQRRLTLAGVRPINNVVDITNYILIQYGQPMHAFDYSTIEEKKIIVKKAGVETTFSTLDNVERQLLPDDLLIRDGVRPVALAGIMGGAGSQITESTRDVFLEAAFFEQVGIRKTSKRLGLSTESSYRFERGVDPDTGLIDALDTAAALMAELAGGTVSRGRIDVYPVPMKRREIVVRTSRLARMLGMEFTATQVVSSLSSLGIACEELDRDSIRGTVPLFRHDLAIEADLVEEIGRIYGYDNLPTAESAPVPLAIAPSSFEKNSDRFRHALAWSGLNEIFTNTLTSDKRRSFLTPDKNPVALLNPLNPEMAQLRTTMAGSMLEALAYNLNRRNLNNRFFEIGKVFEIVDNRNTVVESDILAILVEGDYLGPSWNCKAIPADFHILKGILETFISHAHLGVADFSSLPVPNRLFETEQAVLTVEKRIHGFAGKISTEVRNFFDIKPNVFYAELDITEALNDAPGALKYRQLPKYPALERDFAFVMADEVWVSAIISDIYGITPLVEHAGVFDLFRGEKLGTGRKSIAISVRLRSPERTLTDVEAEGICREIVDRMKTKYGAELRS